jgi:anaerobic selenocysteine-containing dehydrogenase
MYHENPAMINPKTANGLGIKTGDKIKVKSEIGEITTMANVSEGIVPGVSRKSGGTPTESIPTGSSRTVRTRLAASKAGWIRW